MRRFALPTLALVAVAACQAGPAPMPAAGGFAIDRRAALARLAHPPAWDWSVGRATSAALARLRREAPRSAPAPGRALQAVASVQHVGTNAAPFSASGGISSAPGFHYLTDNAYWVTDAGHLLKYNIPSAGNGTPSLAAAWPVKDAGGAAQTFKNTAVGMSGDGRRIYLVSLQGNFLVLNAATGACLYSYNVGRNPSFTNTGGTPLPDAMPAPFVDPITSRPDGQIETVYVASNTGSSTSNTSLLTRFVVDAPTIAIGGVGPDTTVTRAQAYPLPTLVSAPYVEGLRASPVVLNGYAVVGTWRRHATNGKLDTGAVLYVDTGCRAMTTAATTPGATVTTGVPNPVCAAPAVDFDDALTPFMAFVPGDYQVTGVHLAGGTSGQSPPLLVDRTTVPATDDFGAAIVPASSLSNYPYSNTGVQTKTVQPVLDAASKYCAVTVSGDATLLQGGSGGSAPVNPQSFFSYASNDENDAVQHPAYAYTKFRYTAADRYVGSETAPRGVNQIRLSLTNNADSNPDCCGKPYDAAVPPFEGWKVRSALSPGGADWAVDTISPANRPLMLNGQAFTGPNARSAGHNLEKLIVDTASNHYAAGNRYRSNSNPYNWLADGLIGEDETVTFAFYDDNNRLVSGGNNGKPHNVGAPYFDGGTSGNRPKLLLELSASGLSSPTMLLPVAIDPLDQQIYAVNTNALYRISYQAFASTGLTAASVPERFLSMGDTQKTFYCHTYLGQHASYGPIATTSLSPTKRYVGNLTAPLLTDDRLYVQDGFLDASGNPSRTTITEFTYGAAPTATAGTGSAPARTGAFLDLTAANANAKAGATYMVYDDESARMLAGTWEAGTANGRLWVLNR